MTSPVVSNIANVRRNIAVMDRQHSCHEHGAVAGTIAGYALRISFSVPLE